jgi:hypothetical protein
MPVTKCSLAAAVVVLQLVLPAATASAARPAASPVDLAGHWMLNRELSQFPDEVGFGIEPTPPSASSSGGRGGGRGGGGRGGGGATQTGGNAYAAMPVMLTEDDAKKIDELIADAKSPSPALAIAQSETAVTIVDGQEGAHRFHPNGKEETEQLTAGPVGVTSKWSGRRLVVDIAIAKDRSFRYVYSKRPDGRLVVETRLEDKPGHAAGNIITRVYDAR